MLAEAQGIKVRSKEETPEKRRRRRSRRRKGVTTDGFCCGLIHREYNAFRRLSSIIESIIEMLSIDLDLNNSIILSIIEY